MPKHICYTLNEDETKLVTQAMKKDKRPEVRQRATAIYLLSSGHKPAQVAQMLSVHLSRIYEWHKRWREDGVEGLANKPKSGRIPKADEQYRTVLGQVVDQDPQELGYPFTMWTTERLAEHMAIVTGVTLSPNHLGLILKEEGFVYRRPKHDLTDLQDPDAKERAKEVIDDLKKKPKRKRSSSSLWTKQL